MTKTDVKATAVVAKNDDIMTMTLESGSVLDANIVRNYLVSGNGKVTDGEVVMFMELCKAQGLNPFLKDAYLIKYGNNSPAQIIVGKDVFIKRAAENPNFDGMKAGVVVINLEGKLEHREGSLKLPKEQLIGGWCEVYLKNRTYPAKAVVSFDEYAQKKSDGSLNNMWATKGATMIRKVAQSQAMREAFPSEFRGCYQKEEMGAEYDAPNKEIPEEVINRKEIVVETEAVEVVDAEVIEEDKIMSRLNKAEVCLVAEEHGLYNSNTKDVTKLAEYLDMYGYDLMNLKEKDFDGVIAAIKENQTSSDEKTPEQIIQSALDASK